MKNVYIVTMLNDYGSEEMETFVFVKKSNAMKFINEQIDEIIGAGYSECELTTDRDELWFFNNGEFHIEISLDKKEVR